MDAIEFLLCLSIIFPTLSSMSGIKMNYFELRKKQIKQEYMEGMMYVALGSRVRRLSKHYGFLKGWVQSYIDNGPFLGDK